MPTGPNRAWQGAPILPPIALETQLDFEMAEVREGCAYWQAKAAGREMPLHADIRPEEIPRLLPYICLFDIRRSNGTVDIFPRLAGAKFEEVFGSIHNRPLDTVLPPEYCGTVERRRRAPDRIAPPLARGRRGASSGKELPSFRACSGTALKNGGGTRHDVPRLPVRPFF
jgi:hypothetical protein